MKRRLAYFSGLVAFSLLLGLTTFPSSSRAAPNDKSGWMSDFKACQEQNRQTAILFLLDESKSLKDGVNYKGSDPTNARVASVKAALTALAAITPVDDKGKQFQKLFVAIDGFGSQYHAYGSESWSVLEPAALPGLLKQADAFVRRTEESTTDYRKALSGAAAAMLRYRKDFTTGSPASACQLVVWFTDGAYDTEDNIRISPSEVLQLENQVCNSGGLADQLRASNVVLLATGLRSPVEPPDFSWLRRIATGEGCGSLHGLGDLKEAGNADALLDAILRPPIGPSGPATIAVPCRQSPDNCARITFNIQPWVTGFRVLVQSSSADLKVGLLPPGAATPYQLPRSKGSSKGQPEGVAPGVTSTEFTPRRSLLIANSAGLPADDWIGDWTLQFEGAGAAKAAATLAFVGAIRAKFESTRFDLASNEDLVLIVQPQDPLAIGPASDMSSLAVDVQLEAGEALMLPKRVGRDGKIVIAHSEIEKFVRKRKVLASGKLHATVTPHAVVSLPEGPLEVPMQAAYANVALRIGKGFPEVGSVTFTPAVLDNSTSGLISAEVTGPRQGDGLVTSKGLVDSTNSGGFTVEAASCPVPKNKRVTCSWKVTADAPANRTVRLKVLLEATGTDAVGQPVEYPETFEFEMKRPLNQSRLLRTLATLVGLFLVIQIALKFWSVMEFARFNHLSTTARLANLPITVGEDGIVRSPSGGPLVMNVTDLPFAFDFQSSFQAKDAFGLRFEVSRLRAVLFHPTFGVVSGGTPVLTEFGFISPKTGTTRSSKIGLDLSRRWIVVFDDNDPVDTPNSKSARLVVFLSPLETEPAEVQLGKATAAISESPNLQRLFAHLRDVNSTESLAPEPQPSGGLASEAEAGDSVSRVEINDPYLSQVAQATDPKIGPDAVVGQRAVARMRRWGANRTSADGGALPTSPEFEDPYR